MNSIKFDIIRFSSLLECLISENESRDIRFCRNSGNPDVTRVEVLSIRNQLDRDSNYLRSSPNRRFSSNRRGNFGFIKVVHLNRLDFTSLNGTFSKTTKNSSQTISKSLLPYLLGASCSLDENKELLKSVLTTNIFMYSLL